LVHTPTDIGSFVIYWGMGLALSWVYLRTGRFEAAVLTHFIWNVLGILML
ncbi:MAG: CPBP family intramembrane metalloprotease, partial [Enterococcus faecalis]|nr:CPBP family intramembrane metalloprotease [Enterococcus faecalis]